MVVRIHRGQLGRGTGAQRHRRTDDEGTGRSPLPSSSHLAPWRLAPSYQLLASGPISPSTASSTAHFPTAAAIALWSG